MSGNEDIVLTEQKCKKLLQVSLVGNDSMLRISLFKLQIFKKGTIPMGW